MKTKTVLYNYLCLHDVRQGYLTVLTNLYNEYYISEPPFNIQILIQQYPYDKYFKNQPKIENIEFIVVKNIKGKIRRGIMEQLLVPYWALKNRVDAIYMPATFSLFFKVKPILLFFHVSVSFILPQKFVARSKFQASLHNFIIRVTTPKCDIIHCTSGQTRKELLEFVKIDPLRVKINYNGIVLKNKSTEVETEKLPIIESPYLLSVSQFYRLKNQNGVISSFILLKKNHPEFDDLKLVLVGEIQEKDYFDELKTLALEYSDDIIFMHNISDAQLENLYTNCQFFVFLSIFEGFGLTPLEALFYKKYILISNIPTFEEIYSEYAIFTDPNDYMSTAQNMYNILIMQNKVNSVNLLPIYSKCNWTSFVNMLNMDLEKIMNEDINYYGNL